MDDPFLLDQNRIEGHLEQLRPNFERWRQLRDAERPPMGTEEREEMEEEYHYLLNELSKSVRSIRWDVDDLQETLQLMVKAKSPVVSSVADQDSRVAFLARVRAFLDDIAREVAMATTVATTAATETELKISNPPADDEGIADGEEEIDLESGSGRSGGYRRVATDEAELPDSKAIPLLQWRKDTNSSTLSFPTVQLDSLRDLNKRFHNRDLSGFIYRYRYLLGMLAIICLIIFVTVVALAAKHTAASAAAASADDANVGSTVPPDGRTCAPGWTHWWC